MRREMPGNHLVLSIKGFLPANHGEPEIRNDQS